MSTLFSTAVFRALVALVFCLSVIAAPVSATLDCGPDSVPAKCHCCKNPGAGCCSVERHQPAKPASVALAQPNLRDLAMAPAALIALLPVVTLVDFPKAWNSVPHHPVHVALHSFLCIRTV